MAFVRAGAEHAAIFDLPKVLPLTHGYLEAESMADKVELLSGDMLKDDLGQDWDIIFYSAIVHMFSPSQNAELMRRSAKALAPGGRVVVQDFVMNDARLQPPQGAMFALNMLVNTAAGDSYTEAEITSWLNGAGLNDITRIETGPGTAMLVGVRT